MIAGTMRLAPSHETPRKGSGTSLGRPRCGACLVDVLELERAVGLGRRLGDLAPTLVSELDGHARQPELFLLELAGVRHRA